MLLVWTDGVDCSSDNALVLSGRLLRRRHILQVDDFLPVFVISVSRTAVAVTTLLVCTVVKSGEHSILVGAGHSAHWLNATALDVLNCRRILRGHLGGKDFSA